MARIEHPLQALSSYLPQHSFEKVAPYLVQYKVHLIVTKERKTVLGSYKHAYKHKNHCITVNGNLNKYSFLLTLLHELAHLLTFVQYGSKVQSHGKEWKGIYAGLLKDFLAENIFPEDIVTAVKTSLHNIGASACAEDGLMRVLRKYDPNNEDTALLETLPDGHFFIFNQQVYQKIKKRVKRFECIHVQSKKKYLFSPICEVGLVDK